MPYPEFTLCDRLLLDTREDLLLHARLLGFRISSKEKKAVIAARFAKAVLSNPLYLLRRLPFQEVLRLQKMVHAKDHAIPDYQAIVFGTLEEIGLTDLSFRNNKPHVLIYPDLANALKPIIDSYVDSTNPQSGKVRNEQIVMGLINLYGILTVDKLSQFCIKTDPGLTPEILKQTIEGSYYISKCLGNSIKPISLVSPFVFDHELVWDEMEARKSITYVTFTTDQILAAADPEFPMPPETEETRSFRTIYRKLIVGSTQKEKENEAELNRKISVIWMFLNNDKSPGDLLQYLMGDTDLNLTRINELMSQAINMGNHVPRWILKGNSSRSVYEKHEREQFLRKPPKPVMDPGAAKAGIHVPRGEFNKLREENVPRPSLKIGRNDPCPCGSGRKYKQCCLPKMN